MLKIRLLADISMNRDLINNLISHLDMLDKKLSNNLSISNVSNVSKVLYDSSDTLTLPKAPFEIITYYNSNFDFNKTSFPVYLDFLVSDELMKIFYVKDFELILSNYKDYAFTYDIKDTMFVIYSKN